SKALRKQLLKAVQKMESSAFGNAKVKDLTFANGGISLTDNPSSFVTFAEIVKANDGREIKVTKSSMPNVLKLRKYSRAAHSAVFVEVEVDEELGMVNVTR